MRAGMEAGFSSYLIKPYKIHSLLDIVESNLKPRA